MSKIKRVLFIGSKELGLDVLRRIFLLSPGTLVGAMTIDDSEDTRSKFLEFEAFSEETGIDLYVAGNRKEAEEIILESKPDLCLVVGWYWLFSKRVLDSVPAGFVGIHNSLLPRYRGGSPLVWQIINGETTVGFSFFFFTEGMDRGPVWVQEKVRVEDDDYIFDVIQKIEERIFRVLDSRYPDLLAGKVTPVEQDDREATYCAPRRPSDGNIDWHRSARDIYNFIRAQSDPYPGAFTFVGGRELKIWRARIFERPYSGTPGQIGRIADEGLYVLCGDRRAVILQEVEMAGRRGPASRIVRSLKHRMGPRSGREG